MKLFEVSFLALATCVASSPSLFKVEERTSFNPTALIACGALKVLYGSQVFSPGQKNYTAENQRFWTPTNYLAPACVFTPEKAVDVSIAILKVTKLALAPHGLVVLGGRVGLVGVPGLLLGGRISFYSNQYGFALDNVVAFVVVLSGGRIVTANSRSNSDLFWAFKGGGNSIGIITRFDLRTYKSPSISAVASFSQTESADTKAAVIPSIFMLAALNVTVYTSALFYGGTECNQPALAKLNALPAMVNSYGPTTLYAYVKGTDDLIGDGTRQAFNVVSSAALDIVHGNFEGLVRANIWDVAGLQASVSFQPVTENFIQQGINKGGNPQGIDISKAPYFCMNGREPLMDRFQRRREDVRLIKQVTDTIEAKLSAAGQLAKYRYLNDAGEGQKIFQSYEAGNLAKLKAIRAKYDPRRFYTDLMPAGWKVEMA